MRRSLLVGAAIVGAVVWTVPSAPPVSAVDASQIVGTYKVKLKGDGWWRGTKEPYRAQRVSASALLVLSRSQADETKLHVEIRLVPRETGKLVDLATPMSPNPSAGAAYGPAFVGEAFLVGDTIAVIDSGSSGTTYVNALTLQFVRDGARVAGHWLSSFPATDGVQGAGSGIGLAIVGKRSSVPTRSLASRSR